MKRNYYHNKRNGCVYVSKHVQVHIFCFVLELRTLSFSFSGKRRVWWRFWTSINVMGGLYSLSSLRHAFLKASKHLAAEFSNRTTISPTWSSSHPPPHILSFCLARFVQRHKDMDQVVFGLPKREGKPPHQDTVATNSCTSPSFQSHPRRPSGSLALFLWFHTPFHNHRPDNTLARGSSDL